MRTFIAILLLGLFFFSCDTRPDVLLNTNETPTSKIKSLNTWSKSSNKQNNTVIFDTVKLGYDYSLGHTNTHENTDVIISILYTNPTTIKHQGNTLFTNEITTDDLYNIFSFSPLTLGDNNYKIKTEDYLKKSSTTELNLYCFNNKFPVADFTINQINSLNKTYEFDGSNSFDSDANYGGQVIEYEFIIKLNTSIIHNSTSTSPILTFTFSTVGTYEILLRVKDNNNTWSNTIIKTLNVN